MPTLHATEVGAPAMYQPPYSLHPTMSADGIVFTLLVDGGQV